MVLGVVVVITGATVLHLSSPTPLHPFHPLLGRAGQDRLSEHRHLGPQGTQGGARHDDGLKIRKFSVPPSVTEFLLLSQKSRVLRGKVHRTTHGTSQTDNVKRFLERDDSDRESLEIATKALVKGLRLSLSFAL